MNHIIDRPDDLIRKTQDRAASASSKEDDDAPQLDELLFDIGVAVAAYLTLGLVLSLLVMTVHL